MTERELDDFFVLTLKNLLLDMKDCKNYVKDIKTPEYKEILEDYDASINLLSDLLKSVKTIEDLAEQDEETISDVYDLIAGYADNFIISSKPEQKEKDLLEYEKLEELLSLFLDEDDDEKEEI